MHTTERADGVASVIKVSIKFLSHTDILKRLNARCNISTLGIRVGIC